MGLVRCDFCDRNDAEFVWNEKTEDSDYLQVYGLRVCETCYHHIKHLERYVQLIKGIAREVLKEELKR